MGTGLICLGNFTKTIAFWYDPYQIKRVPISGSQCSELPDILAELRT